MAGPTAEVTDEFLVHPVAAGRDERSYAAIVQRYAQAFYNLALHL